MSGTTRRASAIRELAATDEKSLVAAAFFERTIQIWSWETGQQLSEFQSMFDFGGRRLALVPNGSACIVGAWGQRGRGPRGLRAYSLPDGKLMWNRSDIKRIQHVTVSQARGEIYCGVDDGALHIINLATGETISRAKTIEEIISSPYSSHQLLVRRKRSYILRGDRDIEIEPHSFALEAAAFSPDALCMSEPKSCLHPDVDRGGIRLIDLETGAIRWQLDMGGRPLCFNVNDQHFYCMRSNSDLSRTSSLVRLKENLGECEEVATMANCWAAAFSPSGKVLVSAQGGVYETTTGAVVSHLDFPQREYASCSGVTPGTRQSTVAERLEKPLLFTHPRGSSTKRLQKTQTLRSE